MFFYKEEIYLKRIDKVRIIPLGGLNEIGKNLTLIECGKDIIAIDCGIAFPDEDLPGVDYVIPDMQYIVKNADRFRAVFLTHGHEDHIGAIPYLLRQINVPIYGTRLTLGIVENKLREFRLDKTAQLIEVKPGQTVPMDTMSIEYIHVNHSIADSAAIAIHTPCGTLLHTGDFKIDVTPIQGEMIDLARFGELGNAGVLAMMCESTNIERPGFASSERKVGESFSTIFRGATNKRIIVATFASNVDRVQQIINAAIAFGRKVAVSGRSMVTVLEVARQLGYMQVPDGVIIDIDQINRYNPEELVIVTTGSQGEPMSALYRMAYSDHKKVEIGPQDLVVLSSSAIPGNEKLINRVINELYRSGADVVYESYAGVHVSGHACQEELKIVHSLVKPEFFIPVHGEQKHLRKHAGLAESLGMSSDHIFIGDIGNVIELKKGYIKQLPSVASGKVFVDGLGVGDVGSIVLRDRKHLGQDGLIIIVASLDIVDGYVVSGPDIVSRGFVYVRESEELLHEVRRISTDILVDFASKNVHEWNVIKNKIKDDVSKHIFSKTRRSPMILPIIMEV